LRHLLHGSDGTAASIGTLGVLTGSAGDVMPGGGGLTTPGVVELQRVLRQLRDADVQRVAMEVSSHSLDQGRVEGVEFQAAVFTNVTRDHLDYHQTMEAYVAAKTRLMDYVSSDGVLVINADDAAWNVIPDRRRKVLFGMSSGAQVTARDIRWTARGSEWTLVAGDERSKVSLPLLGAFNVANALGAAAAAWSLGNSLGQVAEKLSSTPQVPGRLERLLERPAVLRDYAHTPDALDRALDAVRPFVSGRLVVVFGCGGDRDRGKRPQMGAIAESRADQVILTSDNPRTEDPERILDDIEAGMHGSNHVRIENRRDAIAHALDIAGQDDMVLLAGKGHETYQIRGTTSHPFDEQVIVRELAATMGSRT
jgi:UDP-N-acetylmuramoyl-L-alanyl-D-glutamate--2,6-diaminopimelate ligase